MGEIRRMDSTQHDNECNHNNTTIRAERQVADQKKPMSITRSTS